MLSTDERARYARHLALPDFDEASQARLKAARVLVVGAGGLGCPALQYLAAAGVGRVRLVDPDRVELSNLQRQTLYTVADVGRLKAEAAAERLRAFNPLIEIEALQAAFTSSTAFDLLDGCALVLDGSDNFATRYVVNDACVLSGLPLVFGSVFRYEGQAAVFNVALPDGARGPNYRDLFPQPPPAGTVPDCAEGGVLGVLPGIVGAVMALEAIKLLAGLGETLDGRLWSFDALRFAATTVRVARDPANPLTGDRPSQTGLIDYDAFCGLRAAIPAISVHELAHWQVRGVDFQLIDVREPHEHALANLGGRLIPLAEINSRAGEIDAQNRVVVHCQSGKRSAAAVQTLLGLGFRQVWNLEGGIAAWEAEFGRN